MSSPIPASEQPRTPFGLPTGSVRGIISVLICAFFWVVLLWDRSQTVNVVLGHYFLLGLVLMAFASNPLEQEGERMAFLPWFLRLIFVGGSAGVVLYVAFKDAEILKQRLTPAPDEINEWWIRFLACTFCGFSLGLFARFLMGKRNHVFMTMRAWLSIIAMIMLSFEIVFVVALASADGKDAEFLHYWDCVELAIVSAYFGMRA